jgi:putative ABC transport system substrate-binding protein
VCTWPADDLLVAGLAREGRLIGFGPNGEDANRLLARQVSRVLNGAAPAQLPIIQPTRFELVVNLKTARALGLTVPPSLLARADEVSNDGSPMWGWAHLLKRGSGWTPAGFLPKPAS